MDTEGVRMDDPQGTDVFTIRVQQRSTMYVESIHAVMAMSFFAIVTLVGQILVQARE